VALRMENLGVEHVYQGQRDKVVAFEELRKNQKLHADQIAYVGDDLLDLRIMQRAGLAIAVQDAHPVVIKHADWQTTKCGGKGAAREICELIMQAQGTLEHTLEKYL